MHTIVSNPDKFSQELPSLDKFESTSLDKFDEDYVYKLVYDDVVVKSGAAPDIFRLNFPPATTQDNRGLFGATFGVIGGVAWVPRQILLHVQKGIAQFATAQEKIAEWRVTSTSAARTTQILNSISRNTTPSASVCISKVPWRRSKMPKS